jgi:membrane-associated phospholipid phosphatase
MVLREHDALRPGGPDGAAVASLQAVPAQGASWIEDAAQAASQATAIIRDNAALARAFTGRRREDRRHAIVPYTRAQIANRAALVVTAILLTMLILDPLAVSWHKTLPQPLHDFFVSLTRLGNSAWMIAGAATVVIWILIQDMSGAHAKRRALLWGWAAAAGYVLVAVAGSGLIAALAKYVIGRARPIHFGEFGHLAFNVLSTDSRWASFPSGHSTTAAALAVALGLLVPRYFFLIVCLGFWIAFSRIALLSHYPSDVLGGCVLGAVFAWCLARAFARHRMVFRFGADGRLLPRDGIMIRRPFYR